MAVTFNIGFGACTAKRSRNTGKFTHLFLGTDWIQLKSVCQTPQMLECHESGNGWGKIRERFHVLAQNPQGTLPCAIIRPHEIVVLTETAAQGPCHQATSPGIRGGIGKAPWQGQTVVVLSRAKVVPLAQLQSGRKSEAVLCNEPFIRILELRMLAVTGNFEPQPADDPFLVAQCHNCFRHQNPMPSSSLLPDCSTSPSATVVDAPAIRLLSMRFGSLSCSMSNPMSSLPASRKLETRSNSPKTMAAIASVPMLTPPSPFSSRATVRSDTPIRSANPFTEIRRFRRATLRLVPRDLKARRVLGEGVLTIIYSHKNGINRQI